MTDKQTPPAKTPLRTPGGGTQRSITSFFSKPAGSASSKATPASTSTSAKLRQSSRPADSPCLKETTSNIKTNGRSVAFTPDTSLSKSDAPLPSSSQTENLGTSSRKGRSKPVMSSSPSHHINSSRMARKSVNYAESSDEDEDPFEALQSSRSRRRNLGRALALDDDDYDDENVDQPAEEEEEMADFIVSDESDGTITSHPKKRKRAPNRGPPSRKRVASSSAARSPASETLERNQDTSADDGDDMEVDMDTLPTSTAQQWKFDPNAVHTPAKRGITAPPTAPKSHATSNQKKQKAHTQEPSDRYPWLANILDANRNPPDHPDYNPNTLYVPDSQWHKFSPFEKQYWQIKKDLWNTIVFFKKGKFYELYENDATIGHQLFDFKMTDRVNMRMVGVPESSLDMWVSQFIAKGFKVARVDQMESALGKEMRERGDASAAGKKADKVIRRELACILTAGTLVDGSMLQDDLATYCAAIKETVIDGKPHFGIVFVDCATGQFYISSFEDDVELTKFETFVAQTSPRELLVEKSQISTKALRILKNNTTPTTIWNYLRPSLEFWDADTARMELNTGGYFQADCKGDSSNTDAGWPKNLTEARDNDLVMSALGAMLQYLKTLKIERSLVSQGNFEWYSPIRRNGTLILDGQTLINLEIFANSVNNGTEGTLFALLNKCVSPFGKRLFRQWVCHPLCDIDRINERLDAVDILNADISTRDRFIAQLAKMPDLERLISRVHAGTCRPEDFAKVLNGFEQMQTSMAALGHLAGRKGLLERLVSAMPDLDKSLAYWTTAFDRRKAREERVLVPERGIEEDYDSIQDQIRGIKNDLIKLLERKRADLKCKTLKFTDIGKEIYQIEAPKALKVPSYWRQMSATASVRRYYFQDLTDLVRDLQEAEETHQQISREVASRFYRRFDSQYDVWSQAIRVVSQLDCLASLARASSSLGGPSCRPELVEEERSVVDFTELRHPCMLSTVSDFIPNDIGLGGNTAKINLLTGANAAGKSTILRMTCVAVIMAQIGCYVPASAARLTPIDRIMSRLGANDNIFASQSTFFVELSETKKILSEATPRSLVILDELGRGTSSYDGVAVAQAVLHHVASHVGCVGFFATHYHSLATEFENHPEIRARRMQIAVDEAAKSVLFLYRLEDGVAEGSFGMHCAAMCGIASKIINRAEDAAREWEHTSRLKESLEKAKSGCYIPLGILSDVAALLRGSEDDFGEMGDIGVLVKAVEAL